MLFAKENTRIYYGSLASKIMKLNDCRIKCQEQCIKFYFLLFSSPSIVVFMLYKKWWHIGDGEKWWSEIYIFSQ